MIFVDRAGSKEPDALRSDLATAERKRLIELLRSASSDHLSQLRVTFEPAIWKQVKPQLLDLFSGKCAYCERRLNGLDGEVDHYRPKQNAHQARPETERSAEIGWASRQHLYYSWLAYEWDNLLLACTDCNRQMAKGLSFPIEGAPARFLATVEECRSAERPLLIDPCFDQPADHIRCEESGFLQALTERGQFTLELLGLNERDDLIVARKHAWDDVVQATVNVLRSASSGSRADTQSLYQALDGGLPHQIARQSAFATRAAELQAREIVIAGASKWLATQSFETLAQVSRAAKSAITYTRMGKYRGKKMLPPYPHLVIRRIRIRNFKAIDEIDIEVPDAPSGAGKIPGALALLGENATGKSSILEAVALAILGTEQIAKLNVDGVACLRRTRNEEPSGLTRHPAEIVLTVEGGNELRLSIDLDGQFSGNAERAGVLLGYGPRRFFSSRRDVRRFQEPWYRVKSMFDPLARLPDPSRWLLSCSNKEFNLVVRGLRAIMLLPDEAVVRRGRANKNLGMSTVFFELEGRHESLDTLSEGYKTVIAMGVDIMRELLEYWPDLENAHGVVLIDEIDTHLHPRWKMRIARRLRQALPGVQFLASTHDPLCLRGYFDQEVQVLRRNADGLVEQVPDLPNVQGLSVQQLLTSEYFGLYSTEDPALDETIARYSTLIAKVDRTPAEELELGRQREEVGETLVLGTGPAERVVQDAIREYVTRRNRASSGQLKQLQQEALAKVIDFWTSIDAEDQAPDGQQA